MPLVTCSIDHKVATLTLDHAAKRNCLSEALVDELIAGLEACRAAQIRCVVLRAQPGTSVWSAGHDVSELPEGGRDPLGWKDPLRKLVREIEAFPAPVIAMIEGSVWGGACETVFACDLIVATPESTFAATPARHGVPYNVTGLLTFFNAAHARIANEMLFTAQPIPAMRLERMGIINHVVAADDLEEFTYATARTIAKNAPLSISVMKEQLRILAGAHSMSPHDFERIQGLRRVVYDSSDYAEGIRAFKEKRKPEFTGE
ncbi:MAG TPA: methylmalonyl-CoA decarboxylase [Aromatoleum sp.]|uniref:methylmalonyl-CoA decarboxylase n=1 Tax=Aromatoleum sp. TaxID=2307007 RepID=UPI002B4A8D9A|nr:methylmalonyl-CoA decarboxylase [Aromatoleum sp.]HJV24518.1 methylmalonyl-CoA decarboxylase [Aromatoleum sp.]